MTSTAKQKKQTTIRATRGKREAILRAALEVFAERGVNGVAVPQIAERAGVGTGTIYRYFDSKEALVNVLYCTEKRAMGRLLTEGMDPHGDPKALFDEFWERLVSFARENPAAFRFLELQDHLPYLNERSRELERRVLSPLRKASATLQQRGIFRDDLPAEVIMALNWGAFVQLFKAERTGYIQLSTEDIHAARDACWQMLTGG